MKKLIFIFIFSIALGFQSSGSSLQQEGIPVKKILKQLKHQKSSALTDQLLNQITPSLQRENPKVVALILTGTLGVFGAHRIYLGTDPKIPVFYTITLGGGLGILPAIDFLAILFTKDLSQYYNNDKIFMWSE